MSPDRDIPRPDPTSELIDEHPPLTARSVVASNLLGVDPPRLPAAALVACGELFGLRPGATRTALSRMTAAGEVVAEDGHYALAGPLLERHARQQQARRPLVRERSESSVSRLTRHPAGARSAYAAGRFASVSSSSSLRAAGT